MISANSRESVVMSHEMNKEKAPYAQLMNVSPELAARWLAECNTNNRRAKSAEVMRILRDIRNGEWQVTHQGIAFSKDNVLIDGQNRLHAIVRSQMTVPMYVWFNMDPKSLLVIDQNVSRSKADALNLTGRCGKVADAEVTTLRAMLAGLGRDVPLTTPEIQQHMLAHKEAITFAHQQLPSGRRNGATCNKTVRAVIARAWYALDLDRLRQFCTILRTGIATNQNDQAAAFIYQYLTQAPRSTAVQRRAIYCKVEHALLSFMRFEQLLRLCGSNKEMFPLPEERTQRKED